MTQNVAALFGHADDTLVAWQQACVQAAEALRPQPDPERLAKALALAQDGHVVLEDDGTATVQGSGPAPYTVSGALCDCLDAKKRGLPCKHALAVQIHQHAAALLLPSASPAHSAAPPAQPPQPAPQPKRQARTRSSAAWDVHEAPLSTCLKLRLGPCEWTHTVRASDETELRARFAEFRALVHDMAAELNDLALHLEASHVTLREALEQKRAAATAAPAPQAVAAARPTPEALQQAIVQAVQQALAAQQAAANGQAHGTPPPAPPSHGTAPSGAAPDDQQTGFCSMHQVQMTLRGESPDTWHSHWLEDEQRYCKGVRPTRRNGHRR
jgi:hypothetical protein